MKKLIVFIIIIFTASFLCNINGYGQKKQDNNDTFQSSLIKKFSNLNYVITDLPFCVEADNDLNFYVSDLIIIQKADSILPDTSRWNRHDDRKCDDDIAEGKYSLFCALYKASVDVIGEYLHRRTVMQEVRFVIARYYRDRFNHHRLMDFNNNPETTLEDIRDVLAKSEDAIREQLEEKQEVLTIIHKLFDDINQRNMTAVQNLFAKKSTYHYLNKENDSLVSGTQMLFIPPGANVQQIQEKMSGQLFIKVNQNIGTA